MIQCTKRHLGCYIGETTQQLNIRMNMHRHSIKHHKVELYCTPVGHHLTQSGHSMKDLKIKVRAFQHGFSSSDCSRNVYIKKNGFTLHRNPIAQSTDGARTKIGFSEGRHAWEVWWEGPLGTVAVIGIATKRAPMQCQGYVALLGSDDQSWGWNLVDNNLLHNGEVNGSFPQCNNAPKYQIGERIRVILDMEDKTLAFERGYEFLGVAFRGLPKACLYPAVSAVYGNTEVTLVYLGKPLDG
ncbi:F-box SPRY domain-containing 1 [Pelobates cultripes]|uniref:F-box/SPRY domain-containing protein 1 n=1 Tax=Pelobates cultripes TaxID=61616 RepID=A0AAD1RAK8_PELCU|nr:F-box SPRY domain-containing 1 [Pelobates cultripes]